MAPTGPTPPADRPKARRGFALFSADKLREAAAKGGRALRADQRSFSQNRDLASQAGAKGGRAGRGGGRPRGSANTHE